MSIKRTLSVEKIIELYLQGQSCKEIGLLSNCGGANILKILRENNIKRRIGVNQKYKINESYFEKIDTQEKAYFLGFLYADGCNYTKRNNVCMVQHEKDKDILQQLNNLIQPDKPLLYLPARQKINNSSPQYAISIINKKVSADLNRLGCIPAKSLILTFPNSDIVPEHLISHFMRGYFDGDGCVCIYKSGIAFTVTSTEQFLKTYQDILISKLNISKTVFGIPPYAKENNSSTRVLQYGGLKQMLKIRDFLYKDATIFMDRKHDKFFSL